MYKLDCFYTLNDKTKHINSLRVIKFSNSRILNWTIKLLILGLFGFVVYRQLVAKQDIHQLWSLFIENLSLSSSIYLVLIIALMPINWALETIKWRYLLKEYENLSFVKAYKAILTGVSLSIITPARIGEYGGRLFMVKPENNWKAVIATLVGSFSQNLIHIIIGIIGFSYFFKIVHPIDTWILAATLAISTAFVLLLLLCFFHLDLLENIAKRFPFPKKIKPYVRHLRQLRNYNERELSTVLWYSFIRYGIFCVQYFLILKFFGIEIPLLAAFAGIASIYLVQTSIPLPPVLGVLARGEIALFIWGIFTTNSFGILAATFGLWIINLIIPALVGIVIIFNVNVLKSLGYENET